MQVDALAAFRIYAHTNTATRKITGAKGGRTHSREHFLRGVAVPGSFVKQMVRITLRNGDFEKSIPRLFVKVTTGAEEHPVGIASSAGKVILKPIHSLSHINRGKLGLLSLDIGLAQTSHEQ